MGTTLSRPQTDKNTSVITNEQYYVASSSMQGWRVTMEDAHTVLLDTPIEKTSYFAIFDGHGGSQVSQYASRNLHLRIFDKIEANGGDVRLAIEEGFEQLDEEMSTVERITDEMSGSTAVIVLITADSVYCGNAGDSRAIAFINNDSVALSSDHKPQNPIERRRILGAGASINWNRINGNLAVSRGLGDFMFKKNSCLSPREQAVSCFPEVTVRSLNETWKFIVLACDGIWDVLSTNEVGQFITTKLNSGTRPEEIVELILTRCLAPDVQIGGIGCDNMSIILILFMKNIPDWYQEIVKVPPLYDVAVQDQMLKRISAHKNIPSTSKSIEYIPSRLSFPRELIISAEEKGDQDISSEEIVDDLKSIDLK